LLLAAVSTAIPLTVLAIVIMIRTQLLPSGRDGSDDMSVIVTTALAVATIAAGDRLIVIIALAFITAELCICYATSGISKLIGSRWRSGDALIGIMRTASYGHQAMAGMFDRLPSAARLASWFVICGEIAFPVLVILGGIAGIAALIIAACFQLMIAVTMGLNRFVPWFLTSYPAALWVVGHYGLLRL
jgi:uncharacterized membrane protein YphA (DoxX/SURF4 family)